jgi:hypothetical protein
VGYMTGVGGPYILSDSYLSVNTQGWGGGVPLSGQFLNYPRQFCGKITYDEGCYFKDNWFSYEVLDANLQPTGYAELPGTINLRYSVNQPLDAATVKVTFNLRNAVTNAIAYTTTFTDTKLANTTLTATKQMSFPANFVGGYYKVEVLFNALNSCKKYADYAAPLSTLLLMPAGSTMCQVWPGDVNNDGIVNYGDRASLNRYIFNANLRSTWLQGPNRYKLDAGSNPLTYIKWESQPGVPWATPDGCYMDSDGNGVVNNFDYLAMKLNWTKTHGAPTKAGSDASGFVLGRNYPNPFNPSTRLDYTLPERSQVRIVVTDMLGREVAVLADGSMDAGTHTALFDASALASGTYVARAMMTGLESGESFTRSVTMTLGK